MPRSVRRAKQAPSLRAQALRLLARRDHSRLELERKLRLHATGPVELDALLDDLAARGWLSEQRLADQLLRAAAGRYGARKVVEQLHDKGVSPEVLAQVRERARESELESAMTLWCKRFGEPPADLRERARVARFFERRGFDPEVIRRMLGSDVEE
jgi:regulatory protein